MRKVPGFELLLQALVFHSLHSYLHFHQHFSHAQSSATLWMNSKRDYLNFETISHLPPFYDSGFSLHLPGWLFRTAINQHIKLEDTSDELVLLKHNLALRIHPLGAMNSSPFNICWYISVWTQVEDSSTGIAIPGATQSAFRIIDLLGQKNKTDETGL